jgi:hypothetical protein
MKFIELSLAFRWGQRDHRQWAKKRQTGLPDSFRDLSDGGAFMNLWQRGHMIDDNSDDRAAIFCRMRSVERGCKSGAGTVPCTGGIQGAGRGATMSFHCGPRAPAGRIVGRFSFMAMKRQRQS